MAVSLGKAYVDVEANGKKLTPQLEAEMNAALGAVRTASDGMISRLASTADAAGEDIGNAYKQGATEAERHLARIGVAAGDMRLDVGRHADKAATDLADAAKRGGGDVEAELGKAGKKGGQALSDGVESSSSGLVGKVGALAAAAGAALVAGFTVDQFINANDVTTKLQASLALTGPQAAAAGKIAGDVYSAGFGDSLATVGEATKLVVQNIGTDLGDVDFSTITSEVVNLSDTFGQDLGKTTSAVAQLMRTGLAPNALTALDIITSGFQNGADKSGDLLDTLNEYSTQFRQLGLSGQDATALISQGLKAGARDSDTVANGLKEFATLTLANSADVQTAYKNIGLNASEMQSAIAAGGPAAKAALQQTLDALRNVKDPADQSAAAVALFGGSAEDLKGALFALDPATAVINNVEGASATLADTMSGSVSAQLTAFTRGAQQLVTDGLGGLLAGLTGSDEKLTGFGGTMQGVGQTLVDVGQHVRDFAGWIADNNTPIIVVSALIAAVFLPHLIAVGTQAVIAGVKTAAFWVGSKLQAIGAAAAHSLSILKIIGGWVLMGVQATINAVKIAAAWLLGIIGPAAVAGAAFLITVASVVAGWVLMGVQALIGAAQVALAWIIAFGPIILVGALIVGLVVLIIKYWQQIADFTMMVFSAIWDFIKMVFSAIWDFIVTVITAIWTGITLYVNLWLTVITTVIGFIWNVIVTVFTAVWGFITGLFNSIWTFISGVWNGIGTAISGALDWIWGIVTGSFNKVRDFISTVFSGIATTVGAIWDGIGGAIKTAINGIIGTINKFVIGGVNVLIDGVNLVNPFDDVPHVPRIPLLADGAVVTRPTLAIIGEAGPEAVVPLSRPGRRDAVMREAGLLGDNAGGGLSVTWAPVIQATPNASPEQIAAIGGQRFVRDLRLGLDGRFAGLNGLEAAS